VGYADSRKRVRTGSRSQKDDSENRVVAAVFRKALRKLNAISHQVDQYRSSASAASCGSPDCWCRSSVITQKPLAHLAPCLQRPRLARAGRVNGWHVLRV
jgi:hypothetical protein